MRNPLNTIYETRVNSALTLGQISLRSTKYWRLQTIIFFSQNNMINTAIVKGITRKTWQDIIRIEM